VSAVSRVLGSTPDGEVWLVWLVQLGGGDVSRDVRACAEWPAIGKVVKYKHHKRLSIATASTLRAGDMASNVFVRMYSVSRPVLYRVPLPAAQFLTVGRPSGSSEERSFDLDSLYFSRDASETPVQVANKSAAFRKLVGASPRSPKISVTNMDAIGAKLKHKLGHGYAKVRAVAKLLVAANNAERHAEEAAAVADASASTNVVESHQKLASNSPDNQYVILPESRYKVSDAKPFAGSIYTHAELRKLISAFRGKTALVSPEVMAKLFRVFEFDGSDADVHAFAHAYFQQKCAETDESNGLQDQSQTIEAMNRNARMPKAANHV
jgi:hypothetical protein